MTFRTLIRRSLRFHARSHVGTGLGAAVAATVLIGALVVGDSVRGSLRQLALARLGNIQIALAPPDRFFRAALAEALADPLDAMTAAALQLPAIATTADQTARANHAKLLGVGPEFWSLAVERPAFTLPGPGQVVLNEGLAQQLRARPGDTVLLRVAKPGALSREVPISAAKDTSRALRVTVCAIASDAQFGRFSLEATRTAPLTAFVPLPWLQEQLEQTGRANRLLASVSGNALPWIADTYLRLAWSLADAELSVRAVEQAGTAMSGEPRPFVELASPRIFLEPPVADAVLRPRIRPWSNPPAPRADPTNNTAFTQFVTNGQPLLTYLVNLFRAGTNTTPYSMVTAAGPPYTPADLRDDEIVMNEWLANDLTVQPGDRIDLTYFDPDSGARLVERTNTFRVRAIVPLQGVHADRSLMPEFPGLAKAESTHDWDAGFPLVHKLRETDEDYWKQHRGTPKAFVTLAAGQKMWANRFGSLTAIRYPVPTNSSASALGEALERNLLANLVPASIGLRFEPVREQALEAVAQSQDFGQLFLGFSFFLIAAALLLMALLFQFSIEQRATEVGTLLALGFTPKQVRRLFWLEGGALAAMGSLIGLVGGVGYARAMLHGLSTIWRDAVGTSALGFHAEPATLAIGLGSAIGVAWLTIGLALRKQVRQPARELLAGEGASGNAERGTRNAECAGTVNRLRKVGRSLRLSRASPWLTAGAARQGRLALPCETGWWTGVAAFACAAALVATALARGDTASAGTFFGAGALLLGAGLAFASTWLRRLERSESAARLTLPALGVRNATRRRTRSLATLGLLACGSFLIASIGVFRLDSVRDADKPTSGTGGFALVGESTLPVVQDLNTGRGRDSFALDAQTLAGVRFVPFRVRDGDDASCLNLNRAQKPRLLGVNPEALAGRFTFAKLARGEAKGTNAWAMLRSQSAIRNPQSAMEVPAIGDAASIQWAMGKQVGDTLDYVDEQGRPFKVRLVGAVANSILQGNLLIDEAAFVRLFPSEPGYRMFLIDAPAERVAAVSGALSRALRDVGLELTPAARRLAQFNAVQNTYLGTFQVLGGLGLLLGSAGLGVVVLRNVLERRAELALLLAVGFRARTVRRLVVGEHATLLIVGLGVGLLSAAVAVLPALLTPGTDLPYRSLGATVGAVFLSGLAWTWLATRLALRGELLTALRNE
jgi:ABC-type lipoprotein release transport system permease subunit